MASERRKDPAVLIIQSHPSGSVPPSALEPECGDYSQGQQIQPGEKLLEPRGAVKVAVREINGGKFFPVRFVWLDVRDDLDEPIVGNAKAALREEGSVGAGTPGSVLEVSPCGYPARGLANGAAS